jgi:hypothetical protein
VPAVGRPRLGERVESVQVLILANGFGEGSGEF